jgi:3-hydroxybutyryl-CoA dehydrogenase
MTITHLGIIGAGTMGAGIMINAVVSGLTVTMVDRSEDVLAKAAQKLDRYLARQVEKGRMDAGALPAIQARLLQAQDMSGLGGADLVIEAVYENLDLKQQVFAELEKHVRPDTILASNTSCLKLSDMAQVLRAPSRYCGTHYFSPAEINPVVELVAGPASSKSAMDAVEAFLTQTSREIIKCKDQSGFALNRFFCPYSNEAVHLLDEGLATTGQIDEVSREAFGLAIGPFAVMNIIGTATNLNAVRNLSGLGPFYAPAPGLERQGANNPPWNIDDTPEALADDIRQTIKDRMINSVLLPVTEELAEGVTTLDAIDRGASMAFRFGNTPGALLADLGPEGPARLAAFATSRGQPAPGK